MTFTPPTKRAAGQCRGTSSGCGYDGMGTWTHVSDCPALYPLQPQPGDEPDTLTKLTRLVRLMLDPDKEQALALISEAAEERKDMAGRLDCLRHNFRFETNALREARAEIDALKTKLAAQQERIRAFEDTQRYASDANACTFKMGQQQGRVELATELLEARERGLSIFEILDRTVADDAKD